MVECLKNSITMLYEFGQANNDAWPNFKLLGDENEVNVRYFIMTCAVFDKITQGLGHSKKQAKLAAADKMYEILKNEGFFDTAKCQMDKKSADTLCKYSQLKLQVNPVGLLQEYCMARRLPLPDYTVLIQTNGFSMVCRLNNQSCEGYGKKKKHAKADAAKKMYELLMKHVEEKREEAPVLAKEETDAHLTSYKPVKEIIVKSEYTSPMNNTAK